MLTKTEKRKAWIIVAVIYAVVIILLLTANMIGLAQLETQTDPNDTNAISVIEPNTPSSK